MHAGQQKKAESNATRGSSMATRRTGKEKEKGQLAYPSPLTHTHNRRIRGNPASGGARWASGYDGPSLCEGGGRGVGSDVGSATAPDSDLPRQQDYDEEETGDSKSMRMTLMEEVLLLGLKDREVR